jgi:NAD(P) transhydrogenase
MRERYDLVVIGSGPAGEKAAAMAAYHGRRVAVVERSPVPGGTMVGGVAASKTMREAALYLTGFRRREIYGVGIRLEPALAVRGVQRRVGEVERLLAAAVGENLARHGVDVVPGTARLDASRAVDVVHTAGGVRRLSADAVLVATGSRPFHPDGIAFDHVDVCDSDSASRLVAPVADLVVVGGGAVACEYASIFAALGTRVTLVESRGRLLPFMDAELSEHLAEMFRDEGIDVLLGVGHARVDRDAAGLVVGLADGTTLRPDKVVVAAGRVGNVERLGLDAAGVATDAHGHIVVDEHFRTTAPRVYAAGDVTGPPALASVAMEQGRRAACHAFGLPSSAAADAGTPFGVYSIPEVASVGLTEDAAHEAGLQVEVGRARMSRNARTAMTGGAPGFVKLVFRRDDRRLVGAHVVADSATELVHVPQAVMSVGGTIDYFITATFNTPTATEAFKYAAYDGLSRLAHRATLTANV